MKRICQSRKGFTLAEIILVVAIIVILASAAAVGVVEKINRANQNADAVRLHAAGGYFWTVEGGKVVELDPNDYDPNNPNHRSGGAMDMDFDKVKYIQGTVPNNPPQTYNPGGSGGLNPGTGGSGGNPVDPGTGGGDNPGGNPGSGDNPGGGGAQNPVTPEDPMWNGHPESWWDEHDAEIEKKIQEAISKGVDPNKIVVERDPETGHIINHYIPAASSGSNNSGAITVPNTVTSGTGVKQYTNNSDGTTTVTLMLNTHNTGDVKIRKEADGNYSIYCVGQDGHTVVGNVINYTPDNQWCKENTWIKLTPADWAKLSSTYGFN